MSQIQFGWVKNLGKHKLLKTPSSEQHRRDADRGWTTTDGTKPTFAFTLVDLPMTAPKSLDAVSFGWPHLRGIRLVKLENKVQACYSIAMCRRHTAVDQSQRSPVAARNMHGTKLDNLWPIKWNGPGQIRHWWAGKYRGTTEPAVRSGISWHGVWSTHAFRENIVAQEKELSGKSAVWCASAVASASRNLCEQQSIRTSEVFAYEEKIIGAGGCWSNTPVYCRTTKPLGMRNSWSCP